MRPDETQRLLDEQLAYYQARAGEYDQWWLREGRYDRGPEPNARWFAESGEVCAAVKRFRPAGRVLELACGTGIWTELLAQYATFLTAVDGSEEMLVINAKRLRAANVRYIAANLFDWEPADEYNVVFFAFWLSHVPSERFAAFWELVRRCLAPHGHVFFVDSRREPTSTATNHVLPAAPAATTLTRRLNDGREFEIYKVFYEPEELATRLATMGWRFEIAVTGRYFLYGYGELASPLPTK